MSNLRLARLTLGQFLGLFLIGLVLWSVAFAADVAAQDGDHAILTVVAAALNVRSGPGVEYAAFDVLQQGDQVPVVSYDAATGWWQVQLPSGAVGSVSGGEAFVSVSGNIADVPSFSMDGPEAEMMEQSSAADPAVQFRAVETIIFQAGSGGAIYAINADGSNLRYLTTGVDPVLSPDGRQVAFARREAGQEDGAGSIWLINVDGAGEQVIHENVSNPRALSWSPDGSEIAFLTDESGQGEIWVMNADGSNQRPLFPPEILDDIPLEYDGADGWMLSWGKAPADSAAHVTN